jgi:hypothetical protein
MEIGFREEMNNHGYSGNYDMAMIFSKAMLVGRSLKAFLNERRAQDTNNKTRRTKEQTEYTPQQIYYGTIFEFSIRACDIQSGWRDAFERQREYMRRYLFMGKLNPEKFSQILQDLKSIWITFPLREKQ